MLGPTHLVRASSLLAAMMLSCGSAGPETTGVAPPTGAPAPLIVSPPPRPEVAGSGQVTGPSVPPPPRQGFVQLAVGIDVSCGLLDDRTVRCWGTNADGRAGLGETPLASTPTVVLGLPPARAIAVGDTHACALDLEGRVHCWGDNRYGQLGDGTTRARPTPAVVAALDQVVQVVTGRSHTCARREGGDVRCWGRALHVGDRTRADQLTPLPVYGVTDAVDVTLGPEGGCVLRADHTARCWGFNGGGVFGARPGPFWRPTWAFRDARDRDIPLRAIALGDRHVCIVLEDGHVECAGNDAYGQLMDQWIADDAECDRPTGGASQLTCRWEDHPPPPEPLSPGAPRPPDIWPPRPRAPLPTHTETFPERRGFVYAHGPVSAVVADGQFAMGRTCILAGDQVACFGRHGRWDWGHRRETAMPLTRGAVQLDVGPHHGCAVIADGRAVCWGDNHAGQLGDGTTDAQHDGVYVR